MLPQKWKPLLFLPSGKGLLEVRMHTFFQRPAFSTGSKSHGVFAKTLLCAALTCAAAAFQSAVAAEVTGESIRALGPGTAALEATDGQMLTLEGTTHQVAGSVNFMSMAMTKSSATAQNFIDPDTIKEKAEAYVSPRGTKGPMELYDDYYRFTGENREAASLISRSETVPSGPISVVRSPMRQRRVS